MTMRKPKQKMKQAAGETLVNELIPKNRMIKVE